MSGERIRVALAGAAGVHPDAAAVAPSAQIDGGEAYPPRPSDMSRPPVWTAAPGSSRSALFVTASAPAGPFGPPSTNRPDARTPSRRTEDGCSPRSARTSPTGPVTSTSWAYTWARPSRGAAPL